ncbi:4133_t:CDS:2 [Ambispora leptoticha]|uniref:4133_t:CDS:1 n=1 Tax=Ambispora leptoticha TaxID=144679 RepID=A0A9N9C6R1_9GLOM|nr:4133_t:CDS:2 [Ambispora leptoticha]
MGVNWMIGNRSNREKVVTEIKVRIVRTVCKKNPAVIAYIPDFGPPIREALEANWTVEFSYWDSVDLLFRDESISPSPGVSYELLSDHWIIKKRLNAYNKFAYNRPSNDTQGIQTAESLLLHFTDSRKLNTMVGDTVLKYGLSNRPEEKIWDSVNMGSH